MKKHNHSSYYIKTNKLSKKHVIAHQQENMYNLCVTKFLNNKPKYKYILKIIYMKNQSFK